MSNGAPPESDGQRTRTATGQSTSRQVGQASITHQATGIEDYRGPAVDTTRRTRAGPGRGKKRGYNIDEKPSGVNQSQWDSISSHRRRKLVVGATINANGVSAIQPCIRCRNRGFRCMLPADNRAITCGECTSNGNKCEGTERSTIRAAAAKIPSSVPTRISPPSKRRRISQRQTRKTDSPRSSRSSSSKTMKVPTRTSPRGRLKNGNDRSPG